MGTGTTYGLPTASLQGSEQTPVHLSEDYHYGTLTSRKVVALVDKSVTPELPASTSSLDRIPTLVAGAQTVYTGPGMDHNL